MLSIHDAILEQPELLLAKSQQVSVLLLEYRKEYMGNRDDAGTGRDHDWYTDQLADNWGSD